MQEDDTVDPSASLTFTFWEVFTGVSGSGLFDAANPDNIAITQDGSVWFGTDGNYTTNGKSDAVYYLDMTKIHPTVANAQGRAYRILAVPADAEHTGPCFSSDMKTLFNSIQHPGEFVQSTWPNGQP
jgi:secreted PhoX family phosphatase